MPGSAPRDYALGPLLRRAHHRAARAFDAALQPLTLEGRHFGVLLTLHRLGPMSQQELSRRLGTDKSSMVRLIDALESAGLVERRPQSGDRRAFAITLTEDGVRTFALAEGVAGRVGLELVAHLRPEERDQLRSLLARFVDADQADEQPLPGEGGSVRVSE